MKERLVGCPSFVQSLCTRLDHFWEPSPGQSSLKGPASKTPQRHTEETQTDQLLTPLPFSPIRSDSTTMPRTPVPFHPLQELSPDIHTMKAMEWSMGSYSLLHPPKLSWETLQDSWLNRVLDKFLCPRLDWSPLLPSSSDDSSFPVDQTVSIKLGVCLRFWMTRAFYTIECGHLEWLYNGKVVNVELLSSDFVVIQEHVVSFPKTSEGLLSAQGSLLYHLVFFQTGQVCDTKSGDSYPREWRLLAAQFPSRPPFERLETSINTAFTSSMPLFPSNIHYKIPPQSKEYLVALRFILAHSEGLRGYPEEIALRLKTNGRLFKLSLSIPTNLSVASVEFSFLGYSLRDGIAFIQTYGGEGVYVLADTGLSIGTEMDGVSPTWMEILDCTTKGLPCK